MKSKELLITEIFSSIQGESTFAGKVCFFIRLAGCNLNCSYCDTKYSFNKENAQTFTIEQLYQEVVESGIKLVEITGGEPLLQDSVYELTNKLIQNNFTVLIETNGSILINNLNPKVIKILDCKCPDSNQSKKMNFKNFNFLSDNDEIKFVLSSRKDYEYAKTIINDHKLFSITEKILLSPVSDKLAPQLLAKWMIEDNSYATFQLQLHKIIWPGIEKGV